jgi:hypothetical protein
MMFVWDKEVTRHHLDIPVQFFELYGMYGDVRRFVSLVWDKEICYIQIWDLYRDVRDVLHVTDLL